MARMIVCDTGPLLHLSEIGAIHFLSLAGDILVPPQVAVEFQNNAQGWSPPQWAKVVDLDQPARQQAEVWVKASRIDAGEAEAIGLALQEHADWLLTDDARARELAESTGLEIHGSIGILLWSIAAGHIPDKALAFDLLDNLSNSSLWISERVLQEARKAIDTLFE